MIANSESAADGYIDDVPIPPLNTTDELVISTTERVQEEIDETAPSEKNDIVLTLYADDITTPPPTASNEIVISTTDRVPEETDDETPSAEKNDILYVLVAIGCIVICVVFVIVILCEYKRIQSDKKAAKQKQAAMDNKVMNGNQEQEQKGEIVATSNSDDIKPDDKGQIAVNALSKPADNANEVRVWLGEIVGLSQYIHYFVLNGYDSIEMIKGMNDDDLRKIQIYDEDHRNKIMIELWKLNGNEEGVVTQGEGAQKHIRIQSTVWI